eukprot:GHVS01047977.1.p1 GENE.GHVS01047977.1~~GHVS01047977.1.p1  ORF type:complete len:814 (-),score=175.73 GHVS01047977.1:277-2685(-)
MSVPPIDYSSSSSFPAPPFQHSSSPRSPSSSTSHRLFSQTSFPLTHAEEDDEEDVLGLAADCRREIRRLLHCTYRYRRPVSGDQRRDHHCGPWPVADREGEDGVWDAEYDYHMNRLDSCESVADMLGYLLLFGPLLQKQLHPTDCDDRLLGYIRGQLELLRSAEGTFLQVEKAGAAAAKAVAAGRGGWIEGDEENDAGCQVSAVVYDLGKEERTDVDVEQTPKVRVGLRLPLDESLLLELLQEEEDDVTPKFQETAGHTTATPEDVGGFSPSASSSSSSSVSSSVGGVSPAACGERMTGVRYSARKQQWLAAWSENAREVRRYFAVGRHGFERARQLAMRCRLDAQARMWRCGRAKSAARLGERAGVVGWEDEEERERGEEEEEVDYKEQEGQQDIGAMLNGGTAIAVAPRHDVAPKELRRPRAEPRMEGVFYERRIKTWVAYWAEGRVLRCRRFAVDKSGYEGARQLAIRCRRGRDRRRMERPSVVAAHRKRPFGAEGRKRLYDGAKRAASLGGVMFDTEKLSWVTRERREDDSKSATGGRKSRDAFRVRKYGYGKSLDVVRRAATESKKRSRGMRVGEGDDRNKPIGDKERRRQRRRHETDVDVRLGRNGSNTSSSRARLGAASSVRQTNSGGQRAARGWQSAAATSRLSQQPGVAARWREQKRTAEASDLIKAEDEKSAFAGLRELLDGGGGDTSRSCWRGGEEGEEARLPAGGYARLGGGTWGEGRVGPACSQSFSMVKGVRYSTFSDTWVGDMMVKGKRITQHFAVKKLGWEGARARALKWRRDMETHVYECAVDHT